MHKASALAVSCQPNLRLQLGAAILAIAANYVRICQVVAEAQGGIVAGQIAVETSWLEIESGDEAIQAYLARPALTGPSPALVQVHENLGVTPHRQEVAARLAREGYVTLTPNLFSRVGERPPQDYTDAEDRRRKAFLAAPDEQAVGDVIAAHRYLGSRSDVIPDRIGIIGFCLGGSLALIAACESACFRVFVDFYGALTKPAAYTEDWTAVSYLPLVPRLSCPIQVHVGTADEAISESEVAALEQSLQGHGKLHELHRYPGARHAFHDDTDPRYSRGQAALAEERTFRFLREHL